MMNNVGPKVLDEFQGQEPLVEALKDTIEGPLRSGSMVPHLALFGPGGSGKTTLCQLLATEAGGVLKEIPGRQIKSYNDFLDAVIDMIETEDTFRIKSGKPRRPLFLLIDEAHTIRTPIRDAMLPFLQGNLINGHVFNGKRYNATKQCITIVIATTDVGKIGGIDSPFVQRFVDFYLSPYSESTMRKIGEKYCKQLRLKVDQSALDALVARCRNVPRLLKKLINRCVHHLDARNIQPKFLSISVVEKTMELADIDLLGLRQIDRRYLEALRVSDRSVKSLASCLRETEENIINDIEPYLLELGFVDIEHRRKLSEAGNNYFLNLTEIGESS